MKHSDEQADKGGSMVGLLLAAFWGFHAAAFSYPGRAYFKLTSLNDTSKPVNAAILLMPAFMFAVLFLTCRQRPTGLRASVRNDALIAMGLACWLFAATVSTMLNANVDLVVLTYFSVFLGGAAVYGALAGVRITPRDFEMGVVGLVIGSMFPLVMGLQAFTQEWGTPDTATALNAYRDLIRMDTYQAATFGNRGNTAAFIVIVAPLFLWVSMDERRSRLVRLACATALVPVALNIVILEVRAASLALLVFLSVVCWFKWGIRRYPIFAAGLAIAVMAFVQYSPDIAEAVSDRLRPIVTIDYEDDVSLMERSDAMKEGLALANRHWLVGIGPGAALSLHTQTSAHQLQVQQFLETGVFGLVGSTLFALGVFVMLGRTLRRGQDGGSNDMRFGLIVGPGAYLVYSVAANAPFNVGYVNTWAMLVVSMLALAPECSRRAHAPVLGAHR